MCSLDEETTKAELDLVSGDLYPSEEYTLFFFFFGGWGGLKNHQKNPTDTRSTKAHLKKMFSMNSS